MVKFNITKLTVVKLIILFSFITIFLCSCKKGGLISEERVESLLDENIIGENFVVALATDNGIDITAKYTGYIFVLGKSDLYNGPLQAKKDAVSSTGTWSTNEDFSKLTITLPDAPSEFIFLSRAWRFTSKSATLLKLAPWGSSEPVVLHMMHQ
ncbi:MAG: hypothetical protein ABIN97_01840 [Ginsengibacter sp.]